MGLLTSEYYSGFCCNAPLNDVLFRSEDWSFKQQESILSGSIISIDVWINLEYDELLELPGKLRYS